MTYRSKILPRKFTKQEQELHIITNPLEETRLNLLNQDDYEAPLTAHTLLPNSKWIIVRHNLHKIRSWRGIDTSQIDERFRDWYIFLQMRRELRRAQEDIRQIGDRSDFAPVPYFRLPIDPTNTRRFDVSHVQPSDVLHYPSLGRDPIVLQSLLYYFSKECAVPYDSVFRTFLSNICLILYRDRQRIQRVAVLRKIALVIAIRGCSHITLSLFLDFFRDSFLSDDIIRVTFKMLYGVSATSVFDDVIYEQHLIVFIILGLMLISLIVSVLGTTSNLKDMYRNDVDGGIEWRESATTIETTINY